ncbi:MAG TPA: hypothetical protein VJ878_01815, partial [Candidatus Izemoplasmatales bacterium]|nr:hypothetical protein [Candidatus Izemoplasmatales bacterium]
GKEFAKEKTEIGCTEYIFNHSDHELVNEYLLIKSLNEENPKYYVPKMLSKQNMKYLIGLYLMAKQALDNKQVESYKKITKEITEINNEVNSKIDFKHLLDLEKKNDLVKLKEYLVNPCLKEAIHRQEICLMEKITDKIVNILHKRNRYKDGLNYMLKLKRGIDKIRNK